MSSLSIIYRDLHALTEGDWQYFNMCGKDVFLILNWGSSMFPSLAKVNEVYLKILRSKAMFF